jgi:hypothetical protein
MVICETFNKQVSAPAADRKDGTEKRFRGSQSRTLLAGLAISQKGGNNRQQFRLSTLILNPT